MGPQARGVLKGAGQEAGYHVRKPVRPLLYRVLVKLKS